MEHFQILERFCTYPASLQVIENQVDVTQLGESLDRCARDVRSDPLGYFRLRDSWHNGTYPTCHEYKRHER